MVLYILICIHHGWQNCGIQKDFSWHVAFTAVPNFSITNLPFFEEYTYFYKGVGTVCDYHHYQMMRHVNNFLHKQEAVRSYWLPQEAF
jgi:hypothetical protein